MKATIDENSGYCYGVVRAVEQADRYLEEHPSLFSLGSIVHNGTEVERLHTKGLEVISYDRMQTLNNETVLIRAHGEPPSTYQLAQERGLTLIDCTCPVVLQLQKKIRKTYLELLPQNGSLLIFGKIGHAEVNGLVGQTDGNARVLESLQDLHTWLAEDPKRLALPIEVFSQTTKDPQQYQTLGEALIRAVEASIGQADHVHIHNTICRQVSSRHPNLQRFAAEHQVILFVSGRESSNGHILCELCKQVNPRTYMIEKTEEIRPEWFQPEDSVGICGATSTPKWQLEQVFSYICTSNFENLVKFK